MKSIFRCLSLLTAIAVSSVTANLSAQVNDWVDAGSSTSFADGGNWSFGFAPDPDIFESAKIGSNSGVPGAPSNPTATVTTNLSATPSSYLILGDGVGFEGTLDISSGGSLVTQAGLASTVGGLDVGSSGGTGFLNVSGTGQLTVVGQLATPTSGDPASQITLSDSATVAAETATFSYNTRIVGDSVNFTTIGTTVLASTGTHEWAFNTVGGSSGPSAISVGGNLDLGGTLKLDTLGDALAIGSSYIIADSASVSNSFSSIDLSSVPALGLGVNVRAESNADGGSTNGVYTSIVVEQQPVLIVNHQTGDVSIQNPGSTASIAIDAYTIGSGLQSLNESNWNSLAPSNGWQEANSNSGSLTELNPIGSEAIAGNTTTSLGSVYQPANQSLGTDTEDVTFRFAPEGEDFVDGIVIYEGIPTDTLTLNVDRTTGDAQIINGFHSSVSIDAFVISSDSGSIDSTWSSLGGDWQTAIDSATSVSELNPIASLDLASTAAAALGTLYDHDGVSPEEDFTFQFALPNENFFRTGKVVFDDDLTVLTAPGLDGDFNNDGQVDAADYTIWRDNLGLSDAALNGNGTGDPSGLVVAADYTLWAGNFGASSSSASAASVPEPSSFVLVGIALLGMARRK